MKVWIDMTASAHPLVFRPLVKLLRDQGHEVEITTRDYAQTIQLIEQHGMTAGGQLLGQARAVARGVQQKQRGDDFHHAPLRIECKGEDRTHRRRAAEQPGDFPHFAA